MKNLYILTCFVLIALSSLAQKPEKVMSKSVFDAMDAKAQADIDKNMDEAIASFKKILQKEKGNVMCHFGLSVIYSYDQYTGKDYFEAWKNFKIAYDGQSAFSQDDLEVLNQYFPKVDLKRRNRPLNKNMDWQRGEVEDKLIKFVREENNIEYANKFLTEFPDSRFQKNVEHIRNYIEFRLAEDQNSVNAFNTFIEKYPTSAQYNLAIKQRNKLAYDKAVATNTLVALDEFVAKYPEAEQVEEAKKLMGIIAFKEIEKAPTLEAVEDYMVNYPNSTQMPNAKILKRQLLFNRAKSVNTMEAYNQFVALYPEGQMYIDIFNLKADALGQKILMDFPMENYQIIKGFDNQEYNDYGGDIAVRPDGSILLVANSLKDADSMYDSWVLGLDAVGKMNWNKILGNQFDDQVNKVAISNNNEIFVAGITNAILDSVPGQSWIYKLDAEGKNIYNRKMEGAEVLALALYESGEAIIGGYLLNDTVSTPLITKVNKNGKKLWSRNYANIGKVYDVLISENIAYVAAGNWVAAINASGYLIWDKFLAEGQIATSVGKSGENIVFAGSADLQSFAVSYNKTGEPVWDLLVDTGEGLLKGAEVLTDGSIVLAGTFNKTVKLIQINQDGTLKQQKEFATSKGIELNGITVTTNGSILVSSTLLGAKTDLIVFKLSM